MSRLLLLLFGLACSVPRGGLEPRADASADASLDAPILDAPILDAPIADAPLADAPIPDGCIATGELCNGVDDDCDTMIDETRMCDTGLMGACSEGNLICEMDPECVPAVMAGEETCDGTDDDCDGTVDETQTPCDTGLDGICADGIQGCAGGCMPPSTTLELCSNGLDDDCDRETDESECGDCEVRIRDARKYAFCTTRARALGARALCSSGSMRLVAIEDESEHEWIQDQLTAIDVTPRSWWIGFYDALNLETDSGGDLPSHHRWWPDTASAPEPTYESWGSTEPSSDDEDCVRIREDRQWSDIACDNGGFRFAFICEPD